MTQCRSLKKPLGGAKWQKINQFMAFEFSQITER